MQATGLYDRAAGGLAGAHRAGGVSWTGDPLSEPALVTTVREQYIWSARYLDAPILRDRDSDADGETGDLGRTDSGLDERLYYLTDAHMSVTAIVTPAGAVVERYHYDPYGRVTILDGTTGGQTEWTEDADGSDVANELLYCGYRRDTETGLYHIRHRTYHPHLGRWLQRDPIGYVDGMSLYEYCRSGPVVLIDPFGREGALDGVFPVSGLGHGDGTGPLSPLDLVEPPPNPLEGVFSSMGDFTGGVETYLEAKAIERELSVSRTYVGDGEASMRAAGERIHRSMLLGRLIYLEKECKYKVNWESLGDVSRVATDLPDAGDAVLLVVGGRVLKLAGAKAWQYGKPLAAEAGKYVYIKGMGALWRTAGWLGGAGAAGAAGGRAVRVHFKHEHIAPHLQGTGLSQTAVQNAINQQIQSLGPSAGHHWGWVEVCGQWLQYRSHVLADGVVNIGTSFPVLGALMKK